MEYVIIGNGAAGIAAADKLSRLDPGGQITILTTEGPTVYSKCLLPDMLSGEIGEERLYIRDEDFYAKRGITVQHHQQVAQVDFTQKTVTTRPSDDPAGMRTIYAYDKLLIATGSVPILPKINGLDAKACHTLSTLEDARRIMSEAQSARKITIIGAGFVGLEVAFGLYKQGREVTVVEKDTRALPTQLDDVAACMMQHALEEEGIRLFLGSSIEEVRSDGFLSRLPFFPAGKQKRVVLSDGRSLKSDMIVVAIGSRPNLDFLRGTGLGIKRGIVVDTGMQTSIPDVYAAGDVVETVDAVSGQAGVSPIWPNAVIQGEVAAANMVGTPRELSELICMQNASEFREIPMISMGIINPRETGYEVLLDFRPAEGVYRKLVLQDDRVVGMIFLGDIRNAGVIGALMRERTNIAKIKSNILNPNFGYSEVAALN